jgi:hypothetical protein
MVVIETHRFRLIVLLLSFLAADLGLRIVTPNEAILFIVFEQNRELFQKLPRQL